MSAQWVTFDCFGTLVDWHTGFAGILAPLGRDTAQLEQLVGAYHRLEPILQSEKPHKPYSDVLVEGVKRAAEEIGLPVSESDARALPALWGTMPLFADVEPMLAALRAAGYRLGVLTNCDDDLFAQTHRSFKKPFDIVVTAERVRDYKPSLAHFQAFATLTGVGFRDWTHVACSWFHDMVPARAVGIRSVWLDRDRTGEDARMASVRVESAAQVCGEVAWPA
jgi:2-haloacid dehalogenase